MEYINGEKKFTKKNHLIQNIILILTNIFLQIFQTFFIEAVKNNNYKILNIFDNPIFNFEKVKEQALIQTNFQ